MTADNTSLADRLAALSAQLAHTAEAIREGSLSLDSNVDEQAKILKATNEVLDLVKQPQDELAEFLSVLSQQAQLTALRLFIKWKVFENMPVSETISYVDLGAKVDVDPSLLARLAMNLIPAGILRNVDPGHVAHTPRSQIYMTANPMTAMVCFAFDSILPSFAHMPKFFDKNPRKDPSDRLNTIFSHARGMPGKTVWEILQTQNPEEMANFALAMGVKAKNWPDLGSYNILWAIESGNTERNKDRAILVDVGGGKGQALKAILEATPGLEASRCVLEDLPDIISAVKEAPDEVIKYVKLVGLNFHAEQPVKGALVYYMRRCLHDYGDDECVKIVANLAEAMAPDSRLLIVETIQRDTLSAIEAGMDLAMMTIGGKERTLDTFCAITSRAGLDILQVCTEVGVEGAVIECARREA